MYSDCKNLNKHSPGYRTSGSCRSGPCCWVCKCGSLSPWHCGGGEENTKVRWGLTARPPFSTLYRRNKGQCCLFQRLSQTMLWCVPGRGPTSRMCLALQGERGLQMHGEYVTVIVLWVGQCGTATKKWLSQKKKPLATTELDCCACDCGTVRPLSVYSLGTFQLVSGLYKTSTFLGWCSDPRHFNEPVWWDLTNHVTIYCCR